MYAFRLLLTCNDQGGELLCCDSCTLVFHLHCLSPKMVKVPSGTWHCPFCVISNELTSEKQAEEAVRNIQTMKRRSQDNKRHGGGSSSSSSSSKASSSSSHQKKSSTPAATTGALKGNKGSSSSKRDIGGGGGGGGDEDSGSGSGSDSDGGNDGYDSDDFSRQCNLHIARQGKYFVVRNFQQPLVVLDR